MWNRNAAYQQLLRLERIAESVAPMREHAEAAEEARQDKLAAQLWKGLAEDGLQLTQRERLLVLNCVIDRVPELYPDVTGDEWADLIVKLRK